MALDPISFQSPLGTTLLFRDLHWSESLGGMPVGYCTLLSESAEVRAEALLGAVVNVNMTLPDSRNRYFGGHVTQFRRGGTVGRFFRYEARIHPWIWLLTRTADCRIFLDKTVKTILKEVFDGHAAARVDYTGLYGTYPTLTQCVQYRETDFNFVSRLMEEHGIYYRFVYDADGNQTMSLFDSTSNHVEAPNLAELGFLPDGGRAVPSEGYLSQWNSARSVQPGRFAMHSLNYEKPNTGLNALAGAPDAHAQASYEMYDSGYTYEDAEAGALITKVANDQSDAEFDVYQGRTNAYDLYIGATFKLKWHGDAAQNAKYLVTGAEYALHYTGHESLGQNSEEAHYECNFTAIPAAQQFRAPARTHRPVVQGPQLATVTGPTGKEIYTDSLGRIKVQFHWDRYGVLGQTKGAVAAIDPDKTSCWVPVAQIWAGNNFGAMFVPRIGQEVVVEFFEGDPDRPIVTGRVYNSENPPPWALPASETQSGVLTRSSPGGGYDNANMLRFEDKKGAEKLSIHAEKDQDISVENDETHDMGHDRRKTVGNDETTEVKHDRVEKVGNDEKITVVANRTEDVGGDEKIHVHKNRTEDVDLDERVTIGGDRTRVVQKNDNLSVQKDRGVHVTGNAKEKVEGERSVRIDQNDTLDVGHNFHLSAGMKSSSRRAAPASA